MCFYTRIDKAIEYIKKRFRADFENSDWFEQQVTINGFTFLKHQLLQITTIVTIQANELVAEDHNSKKRMPVLLHPENETNWLNGAPTKEFEKIDIELIAIPMLYTGAPKACDIHTTIS